MSTTESVRKAKWQALQESVARVADNWDEEIPLEGVPGTRPIYLSVAHKVIDLFLRDDTFKWPSQWLDEAEKIRTLGRGDAITDGFRVIAFHVHNGCFAIGANGQDDKNLGTILKDPRSFEPLSNITREVSKIAGRVETEYGLHVPSYSDEELIMLKKYTVCNEAVDLNGLAFEIMRQRLNAFSGEGYNNEPDNTLSRCRAERAGVLKPIYHHIVEIALKDKRLAMISFQRGCKFSESITT